MTIIIKRIPPVVICKKNTSDGDILLVQKFNTERSNIYYQNIIFNILKYVVQVVHILTRTKIYSTKVPIYHKSLTNPHSIV